eukprot:1047664_1
MGNLLPQPLYYQKDLTDENANKIVDHENLTIIDGKSEKEIANESVPFQNGILVEAYVRSIEELLYAIVPDSIKHLLRQYYSTWMKLPPPPKTTLVHPYPLCYYSSTK